MSEDIHIGKLIYSVMEEEGRAASWLAKKLHYDKSNIYRIFKNSTINTHLLLKISMLLRYDFFHHYSIHIKEHNEKTSNK